MKNHDCDDSHKEYLIDLHRAIHDCKAERQFYLDRALKFDCIGKKWFCVVDMTIKKL